MLSKPCFIISTLFLCLFAHHSVNAQNARLQFVHNCPDLNLDSMDVYLNGTLWANNLGFRNATAFLNITAGAATEIKIANKESVSVDEAFYTYTFTTIATVRYQLIASGVVSEGLYHPFVPFEIHMLTPAKEASEGNSGIELAVYNGCTDLAVFDLAETNLIQINAFDDAAYGQFSAYESIFNAAYTFTLQSADNQFNLGVFDAPLSTLGFGNKATTIVASGFLNPHYNHGGAPLGLFLTQPTGGPLVSLPTTTASIQFLHNSADEALNMVDIYLNGQKFLDDFNFRTSSAFLPIPAQNNSIIDLAPNESSGVEQSIFTTSFQAVAGDNYAGTIQGIYSQGLYNPSPPLSLSILSGARTAAMSEDQTDLLFVNGSTDSPTLTIIDSNTSQAIATGMNYSNATGYISTATVNTHWKINNAITWEYIVPLADSNLFGQALTFLANGFIHPEENNQGDAFGLWYAPSNGGAFVELERIIIPPVYTRAQLIHNSADPLLSTVDVYANGQLVYDNLSFRQATAYIELEISLGLEVALAPQNSTSPADSWALFHPQLQEGGRSVIVINGVASATGFNPAPQLSLHIFENAREEALSAGNTDILICHGGTDSPSVDINEMSLPLVGLVDNLAYGNFAGYYGLGTSDNYVIAVTDASGLITMAQYALPLSALGLENKAITLFAGGFLNPINNSNGVPLHVWGATAEGSTFALPVYVGVDEQIPCPGISLYPNPVSEKLFIRSEPNSIPLVSLSVMDIQGRKVFESPAVNNNFRSNEIDVSMLPTGVYLLDVNNGQLSERLRFSVIR